jgi:hypothetical protein
MSTVRRFLVLLFAIAVALPSAASALRAQAPAFEVLLLDGRSAFADRIRTEKGGALTLRSKRGDERIEAARVLCVLGGRAKESSLPRAYFAGGDLVRGMLTGGNEGGDRIELQSPTLGSLTLPVDRLECLVLRPDAASSRDLVLPDGASEALFLPAALGFDRIAGALHQFGADGIRFQPEGQKEPRWYSSRDLVGLRIDGAEAQEGAPIAELITRSGDRVALSAYEFVGEDIAVTLLGGDEKKIAQDDVACLLRLDQGAQFASRLDPARAVEASFAGDALLPWQRDLSANGAILSAGGRCYARGLGVHSRSRLEYVVPKGAKSLLLRVAFDDSAGQLRVRGHVAIAVRIGDAAPVFASELKPSDAPKTVPPIAVQEGQVVALEVEFGEGRDLGDRVDWLLCAFLP